MSCLKLSVKSACSNVAILRDTFDVVKEIIKLVKDSPKAEEIKEEELNTAGGIHTFCPTRWTVKGATLDSIEQNRDALVELFESIAEDCKRFVEKIKSALCIK